MQPVAINGKSTERKSGENKPNPLRPIATGCVRRSMVRRGSTVRVRQRALLKAQQARGFCILSSLHFVQHAQVWNSFWNNQRKNAGRSRSGLPSYVANSSEVGGAPRRHRRASRLRRSPPRAGNPRSATGRCGLAVPGWPGSGRRAPAAGGQRTLRVHLSGRPPPLRLAAAVTAGAVSGYVPDADRALDAWPSLRASLQLESVVPYGYGRFMEIDRERRYTDV